MTFPMTIKCLAEKLGLQCQAREPLLAAKVNSLTIEPGELFIALPGTRVDGHSFLGDAASRGARAALVSQQYRGESFGLTLLPVPDVLDALHTLGREALSSFQPKVIAITGSLGKTTTKEFTSTLLGAKYRVGKTPGNANSQIGLPLSLLHLSGQEEVVVLEMGITGTQDLPRLLKIAPPDIALLTTVALVHACNFEGIEEIAFAKGAIFSHPHTKIGLLPPDIPCFEAIRAIGTCRKVTFSVTSGRVDYFCRFHEGAVEIYHEGVVMMRIPWHILGRHHLHNYLGALSLARVMGLSWEEIAQASLNLELPPYRLQQIEKEGVLIINDAYNANPDSMAAALESLPTPRPGGRRFAALGDMRELGKYSQMAHEMVVQKALHHVDTLFCIGEGWLGMEHYWHAAGKEMRHFPNREELFDALWTAALPGDVVLLKGSRPHELYKIAFQ